MPVFNVAETVGLFMDGLTASTRSLGESFRIIALDGASTDGSPEIIEKHSEKDCVRLIRFKERRALGALLRIGLMNAAKASSDDDPITIIEPDISISHAAIAAMIGKFRAGAEIISASRFMEGGAFTGLPPAMRCFIFLSNFLLRSSFPLPNSSDYTYMLKMYKAAIVRQALKHFGDKLLTSAGAFAPAEFFIKSCLFSDKFDQVPAAYNYCKKTERLNSGMYKELAEFIRLFRVCKKELEDYVVITPE